MTPATPPTTWPTMSTAQRVTAVSGLAAMRLSTRTMASRLGTSRNAVIGLARRNRIGLCQTPQRSTIPAAPKAAPVALPPKVGPSWLAYKVYPMPPEETWAPLQGPVVVATTSAGQSTRRACRWPSTEPCHHPRARGSYCATHGAMAYAPKGGEARYADWISAPKLNRVLEETAIEDVAGVVPREKMEGVE